jgi:hypothetical protein
MSPEMNMKKAYLLNDGSPLTCILRKDGAYFGLGSRIHPCIILGKGLGTTADFEHLKPSRLAKSDLHSRLIGNV